MERTVLMEIPISLVTRIADVLDEYEFDNAGGSPSEPSAERVFVPGQGPWTASELNRLVKRLHERNYHLVVNLLTAACATPGEWVLAPSEGAKTIYHVRNQLSAMSKLIKKDFDGREYWPMQWKRGEDGSSIYRVLPEIAEWWLAAVNDDDEEVQS